MERHRVDIIHGEILTHLEVARSNLDEAGALMMVRDHARRPMALDCFSLEQMYDLQEAFKKLVAVYKRVQVPLSRRRF